MPRISIEEFYQELDATQESYVRKKLDLGYYTGIKLKHARHWIAKKDAERTEREAARDAELKRKNLFWARLASISTIAVAVIAVVALWLPKT